MSEKLLKAIIHLLAIVANEDEVHESEILSIKKFLVENVGKDESEKYLKLFNRVSRSLMDNEEDEHLDQKMKIVRLAKDVNQELTQQQKLVVILNLVELIIADGIITERENELVYFIGNAFKFSDKVIDHVKSFVINSSKSSFNSANILLIDNGLDAAPTQSKYAINENLDGFFVFFRIPTIETYFVKYIGDTSILLNGSPLRHNRVAVFSSGSAIRGNRIEPIYYGDIVSAFRDNSNDQKLSFIAKDVSYKFKNGSIGLQNINIAENSGKLIGIMGGSGAGKSTLLNVLNGNEKPSTGQVRINGVDIHNQREQIEGVIGYVPQDDLLMEDLSVYQNLFYAAKLCFDNASNDELHNLINKTLVSLGLAEISHHKVGNPLEKIISGGQRKRLNIGLELLREPSVLFVDEPTSGLSSRDSENIMDLLKELTLKGKMIFVVIHQPSSDVYKLFDKMIILDIGGYQVYYGNPIEGVIYFKKLADMVDKDQGSCPECGNINPEQVFNIIETKVVNEYGRLTDQRKVQPELWYDKFKKKVTIPEVKEVTSIPEKTLDIPNILKQASIFIKRDFLSKISNKQYLVINFLQAPLLAGILAFIVRYIPEDQTSYQFSENINIPAFFFMSVIVSLFMGLTISAEEIIRDRKILKRESFLNLSRLSYLSSKTVLLFILSSIQTISFIIVGIVILEIKDMTLSYWVILFSISCFANILGLNISSAFNSAVTVYIVIPMLIIPQLILSGVVVNFDKLNPLMSSKDKVPFIGEIMASRWAYESLLVTQFKDNPYERTFYEFDKVMADGEYKTVYYLPRLVADLEYCHIHYTYQDKDALDEVTDKLKLIKAEIESELAKIGGKSKFPEVDKLTPESFDGLVFEKTKAFLERLRKYYNAKINTASDAKDKILASMNKTPQDRENFKKFKSSYENEGVIKLVKNTTADSRMIEHNNRFIQKIHPIFMDFEPSSPIDFRGQFYIPTKHFLGVYFDTVVFNIVIIWLMTLLLFVTLYFDVLRKIIEGGFMNGPKES